MNKIKNSSWIIIPKDCKKINNKRPKINTALRQAVWLRWIGPHFKARCFCCNQQEITVFAYHAAHVIAHAKGGSIAVDNLRPTCASCNLSMQTKNLYDYQRICGFKRTPWWKRLWLTFR